MATIGPTRKRHGHDLCMCLAGPAISRGKNRTSRSSERVVVNLATLESLTESWRREADVFRRYGSPLAGVCELHAEELEERIREWQLETLTLEEAAAESGLSYSAVQKKVRRGEWPNAGKKGAPRVERRYVLGASPSLRLETGEPDLAGEVLMARE